MRITAANTGDLLCLYQTGKWIRVLAVEDGLITYQQENGERYATHEQYADAFVDHDPVRRSTFDHNSQLGHALNAAEIKALRVLASTPNAADNLERANAGLVLSVVQEQKKAMSHRLQHERSNELPGRELVRAFLDQLYEMGAGSHDTFFGRRVENLSSYNGNFSVDGQRCDYHTALSRLSAPQARAMEQKKVGLDAQIASAKSRQGRGTGNHPTLSAEKHGREDGR